MSLICTLPLHAHAYIRINYGAFIHDASLPLLVGLVTCLPRFHALQLAATRQHVLATNVFKGLYSSSCCAALYVGAH